MTIQFIISLLIPGGSAFLIIVIGCIGNYPVECVVLTLTVVYSIYSGAVVTRLKFQ